MDPDDAAGDSHFAVLAADLHLADPPVSWFYSEPDEDGNAAFAWNSGRPEALSVTAFALTRVAEAAGGGGFVVVLDQLADLYRRLRRWSACHTEFDGREWDEADNLFVEVSPVPVQRGRFRLTVAAGPAARRDDVPDFLWRYARLSDNAHGIFAKPG